MVAKCKIFMNGSYNVIGISKNKYVANRGYLNDCRYEITNVAGR